MDWSIATLQTVTGLPGGQVGKNLHPSLKVSVLYTEQKAECTCSLQPRSEFSPLEVGKQAGGTLYFGILADACQFYDTESHLSFFNAYWLMYNKYCVTDSPLYLKILLFI